MANLTVTIAVATGTQYQVGGSGNVFTFDGSQPASYTFPWVKTGTVRLDQSGSTNDVSIDISKHNQAIYVNGLKNLWPFKIVQNARAPD